MSGGFNRSGGSVNLLPGDIQIGAVEIKDQDSGRRADVESDGVNDALVVMQNSQPLPAGAAEQATLVAILGQLDITLSALRDALQGAGTKDFSTLETDVEDIAAQQVNGTQASRVLDSLGSIIDDTNPLDVHEKPGIAEHHNGTASVVPATVTFSAEASGLLIESTGLSEHLYLSLDGGASWKTIWKGTSMSIDAVMTSIQVKTLANTESYEIIALIG